MPYERRNVWELGKTWADPILWYARGVKAMKARTIDKVISWDFYGAIHGIDPKLWQQLGYYSPAGPKPVSSATTQYWKQCQHGSWYFLPWHRGYLLAFEANIRAAVAALKGPADWALPYWNYFKSGQSQLPQEFATNSWPDGGDNPLFVSARYGPNNDGNVYVPLDQVNLNAVTDPDFTGVASGGSPGFGGVDTGFSHAGTVHGGIETQPHDYVHGLVGGSNPKNTRLPGLMSDPDTAALDPIFWLHHANIDRLWEVWRQNPASDVNPTDPKWVNGPASIGERAFSMPMPDNSSWNYTPGDMVDLAKLGYTYDDLAPAVAPALLSQRLVNLGAPAAAASAMKGIAMPTGKNVELVGASTAPVPISGAEARTSVHLDTGVRNKVSSSLAVTPHNAAPDRVFLNLENVRGLVDSTAFHVYVGLPQGANPSEHPENFAGSIALFGVRKATVAGEEHGGQGLTFVLEITKIVDALHLKKAFNVDSLDVRIVPLKPVPADAEVSIGRVSIFRQGE